MYAMVRKYAGKGGLLDRLAPQVRDGLVPVLRRAPGFKGYCAFASEDGHLISVSVFDDRQSAVRANEQARGWVVSNLGGLLPDPPEVLAGEALLHEVSRPQGGGGAEMFATIRVYEGVGPEEEVLPWVREHVFLTITGAPGFRGYYALLDERDPSRGMSASLFDTREHAMEANRWVLEVMRDRSIAPNPPSVMAGRVVLAALAEG
jgi:hypothetical protein